MIWILMVLIVLLCYGIFIEPHLMRVRAVKVSAQQGLKIAHFTDTHFTWHTSSRRFVKFAKNMAENQPDIIIFTGDLYDKVSWAMKQDLTDTQKLLSNLTAPLGKFAILGNHDFEENDQSDFIKKQLELSGFTVLQNETAEPIQTSRGMIRISGLDDLREGQPDFELTGQPADFSLLMIHEPDSVLQLKNQQSFDLIIAGHSHGGQIRIGSLRMRNDGSKSYDRGPYQLSEQTLLYVNSGIGLTFLPIRFGVPPEIVYYEI